jgi:CheY-like chemotaxis protein
MQPTDLDLNDVVRSLAKMLQRIIGEDVRLQLHLHPTPLPIHADAGMIDQVLLNLAVNARDAMPQGGRLVIETAEVRSGVDDRDRPPDVARGHFVRLTVRDSGHGIPPEVLPRIFEPIFTTKEAGKGTGLGLATVFGIVKQHQGWVRAESVAGEGAAFHACFPARVTARGGSPAEGDSAKAPRGTETILIAEDDQTLRTLTRVTLERAGYSVHEAANAADALALWGQFHDDIDLLLTDLVMPGGTSGEQLAALLRADRPALPVVFTSGYSATFAGRELELATHEQFLQKPASPAQLLAMVRRALDARK